MNDQKAVSVRPVDQVRSSLTQMSPEFVKVLPKHVTADQFIRIVMTAVQDNPELLLADRTSFFSACMKCAQDGLLPDKREAALVVFKDRVAYMPMVGGILKKVRNSGELVSISTSCVFEKDRFDFGTDSTRGGDYLEHHPDVFATDRGEMKGAFAIAITKGGGAYIEVMSLPEIKKVQAVSRAKTGPWQEWFDEMAKKTVIRRLSKRLPMSTDLEKTIHADDELYALEPAKKEAPQKTKSDRLSKIVESTALPAADAPLMETKFHSPGEVKVEPGPSTQEEPI